MLIESRRKNKPQVLAQVRVLPSGASHKALNSEYAVQLCAFNSHDLNKSGSRTWKILSYELRMWPLTEISEPA